MKAFDKIIGYDSTKAELMQIADMLANPERYDALGATPPRGILLDGKPGVGKSLMAEALIQASGCKAFVCRRSAYPGGFANKINATFEAADTYATETGRYAIVLLDDMDKFANGNPRRRDQEEYVAVQSCIDDYRKSKIFVLATTNSTCCLPDSLMRSGRLGNAIPVPTPHGATAEAVFKTYLADYKIAEDVDIPTICKILEWYSCATIEAAAKSAGALAAYRGLSNIDMDCMTRACLREIGIIPSIHAIPKNGWRDVDPRDSTNIKATVAIHEAGHALVAELLNPGSVTYICLAEQESSQPSGTTGLVKGNPSSHLRTQREHAIMIGLGGLSAVELVHGGIDFGSKRDWDKAFAAAENLISSTQVLNPDSNFDKSDTFTDVQASVVHALMDQYRYRVREMLAANRDTLLALAQALLDKGLLLPPEIQRIMASHNPLFEPKQDQTQLATPLLKRAS